MLKDHEARELINEIRDELVRRGPTVLQAECLREVLAKVVSKLKCIDHMKYDVKRKPTCDCMYCKLLWFGKKQFEKEKDCYYSEYTWEELSNDTQFDYILEFIEEGFVEWT